MSRERVHNHGGILNAPKGFEYSFYVFPYEFETFAKSRASINEFKKNDCSTIGPFFEKNKQLKLAHSLVHKLLHFPLAIFSKQTQRPFLN